MKIIGKYLEIDWENWLIDVANKYENKDIVVEVKEYKENRSNAQNRFLWGVIYKIISESTGDDVESIHEFLKAKFLYEKRDGKPFGKIKSTTELNTKEFYDYVENIKNFVCQFGIIIPEANQTNILRSYEDFIGK